MWWHQDHGFALQAKAMVKRQYCTFNTVKLEEKNTINTEFARIGTEDIIAGLKIGQHTAVDKLS